jgi:hypothetical protein
MKFILGIFLGKEVELFKSTLQQMDLLHEEFAGFLLGPLHNGGRDIFAKPKFTAHWYFPEQAECREVTHR